MYVWVAVANSFRNIGPRSLELGQKEGVGSSRWDVVDTEVIFQEKKVLNEIIEGRIK